MSATPSEYEQRVTFDYTDDPSKVTVHTHLPFDGVHSHYHNLTKAGAIHNHEHSHSQDYKHDHDHTEDVPGAPGIKMVTEKITVT